MAWPHREQRENAFRLLHLHLWPASPLPVLLSQKDEPSIHHDALGPTSLLAQPPFLPPCHLRFDVSKASHNLRVQKAADPPSPLKSTATNPTLSLENWRSSLAPASTLVHTVAKPLLPPGGPLLSTVPPFTWTIQALPSCTPSASVSGLVTAPPPAAFGSSSSSSSSSNCPTVPHVPQAPPQGIRHVRHSSSTFVLAYYMLFISKGGNKKQNKKDQLPESLGSDLEGRPSDPDHRSGL